MTDQAANIAAIEVYMGANRGKTPEAAAIRDEFLAYMADLGWYDREFTQGAYDKIRNYKVQFNRANAVTASERAAVEDQANHGMSSEEMTGGPDRRLSTGEYAPASDPIDRAKNLVLFAGGAYLAAVLLKSFLGRRSRS
jgi:hypothetical protein